MLSQLGNILPDTSLDMNILERYIRSLTDCNIITTRITKRPMKYNGFRRVPVSGGIEKKDGCGTQYMKDETEVHQKKVGIQMKMMLPSVHRREALCQYPLLQVGLRSLVEYFTKK